MTQPGHTGFSSFPFDAMLQSYINNTTDIQNKIDACVAELAALQSVPEYAEVLTAEIHNLENRISSLSSQKQRFQDIADEITIILNLPQEDKNTLYYFYTVVGESNSHSMEDFMCRVLFNHQPALHDPVILKLMEDTETMSETKIRIAKICYDKYRRKADVWMSIPTSYIGGPVVPDIVVPPL
jgi:hypothetical protein